MNPAIKSKIRRLIILSCIALLIFLLGLNSGLTEAVYSSGIYQLTSVAQRLISSPFPFAVGDFLYLLLIIYCLWSVFKAIRKIKNRTPEQQLQFLFPLQITSFTLILYIAFKLLWGLNYSRPSVSRQLGISNQKYTTKDLVLLGDFLISRVNTIKQEIEKKGLQKEFNIKELESGSKSAYDRLARTNSFFTYRVPAVKAVIMDLMITKMGIEGYYAPPSGEANVNMRIPAIDLPFITCHEISHELGVAREDEANLVGYLVSTGSTDLNFQYSGYYNILRNVLLEIRIKSPEDYGALYKKINAATLADFLREQEFWKKYNSEMSGYLGAAFDKFLKINNQTKGTDSYQDIVLWVFNLHKKELAKTLRP
ncbi:zinc-binding protein [Pedobacter lusitanus]|uniref:Zinc-binding protein n=1 Tax=Pedobacter lusitanus TaxID=1503925 RepID=A0A0D0GSC5_9SPHI|nr:DUF3810 domain-containing protein [Pedobacter lusitanus]KIO77326.1 zinc-binding protein [Pedobacter lusitanus]